MNNPKHILIIGEDPAMVDFSDPVIPAGTTAQSIQAGLDASLEQLRSRGHQADLLLVTKESLAAGETAQALKTTYDCIVIGAGLRIPLKMTGMFEVVLNAVHEGAPKARLAFNVSPDESAAAAERQLART